MQYSYFFVLTTALVAVWLSNGVTDAALPPVPLNGGPCPYDETDVDSCGMGCWCRDDYAYCVSPNEWSDQHCDYVGFVEGSNQMTLCPFEFDAGLPPLGK
ncbi:PREDICTED: uncharacterized protein LOC109483118 isoform X2 [Branchiostoma belcheri]|uniref:Uncharacterized protein LOC109483118 isoform X2 n=1 Tax=Branchiostoma belcheri TaxID=7741 RepID=A0A6P5AEI2_BRABE|nr:PREDICTED: uncharacterized protein LOC109483118 isoform X2 [Branchiostoma belcheri]